MKKLITSAGLVAIGAAGLQAQPLYAPAPGLARVETTKPWSVSATLRGFYDDNYVTRPRKEDSFGIEVSPALGLNFTTPQTYIGASYVYGMRWYEARPRNQADHTHQANAKLSHAFTERYRIDLSNSFVAAQEPELLAPAGAPIVGPLRAEGDNFRNSASATLTAQTTEQISTVVGYTNDLWSYQDAGPGSRSAILDRMEHLATINLRYQILPATVGILGYQFGAREFSGNQLLAPGGMYRSWVRDSHSHYAYLGVDQAITAQLSASVRAGAQYTIYPNVPAGMRDDVISPYVDANVTYAYGPAHFAQLGVRHTRAATDIALFDGQNPTLDQEVTAVYGSVNHQITPGFVASLLGQYQRGDFQGGAVDGQSEDFLLTGVNLSYDINPFLTAEVGYNFDWLGSDLNRGYNRNRVYIGIRASY
jgi:hypothetical protein